jgi:flavodoxin
MRTLIVLFSYHHNNTRKIAGVFARVLDAQIKTPQETDPEELQLYDLVGFGSGIYSYQHHASLLDLADKMPQVTHKEAFIFSTTGAPIVFGESALTKALEQHIPLRQKLESKGYRIVDEFVCAGFNTNSFIRIFGGTNRGRPNAEDLKRAEEFALKLKMEATSNIGAR